MNPKLLLLFLVGLIMFSLGLYILIAKNEKSELSFLLLFFGLIMLLYSLTFTLLSFEKWRKKGQRREREKAPPIPIPPPPF